MTLSVFLKSFDVGHCCSHQALIKLLNIAQRANADEEMWQRHFKTVLLILLDLMKDDDVSGAHFVT